ncbi:MAG: hypothetical protein ABIL45_03815 [candidate division WOR-3 bacterium]
MIEEKELKSLLQEFKENHLYYDLKLVKLFSDIDYSSKDLKEKLKKPVGAIVFLLEKEKKDNYFYFPYCVIIDKGIKNRKKELFFEVETYGVSENFFDFIDINKEIYKNENIEKIKEKNNLALEKIREYKKFISYYQALTYLTTSFHSGKVISKFFPEKQINKVLKYVDRKTKEVNYITFFINTIRYFYFNFI